jgi:hypothetical protein
MPDEMYYPCTDRASAPEEYDISLSERLQSTTIAGCATLAVGFRRGAG